MAAMAAQLGTLLPLSAKSRVPHPGVERTEVVKRAASKVASRTLRIDPSLLAKLRGACSLVNVCPAGATLSLVDDKLDALRHELIPGPQVAGIFRMLRAQSGDRVASVASELGAHMGMS